MDIVQIIVGYICDLSCPEDMNMLLGIFGSLSAMTSLIGDFAKVYDDGEPNSKTSGDLLSDTVNLALASLDVAYSDASWIQAIILTGTSALMGTAVVTTDGAALAVDAAGVIITTTEAASTINGLYSTFEHNQ